MLKEHQALHLYICLSGATPYIFTYAHRGPSPTFIHMLMEEQALHLYICLNRAAAWEDTMLCKIIKI